ncbi:MAG: DUF3793 family protein [Clostridia bacterium]
MSIEMLVKHCAPTLAGMKVGNLVSYSFDDIQNFKSDINKRNKLLNVKGIYFVVLKIKGNTSLVYVYRKSQLEEILKNEEVRQFLKEKGYESFDIESCFDVLKIHLINKDFPHEIGVFLGYPLEDIKAFIKYKGMNYKVVGCWKSYTDEDQAKKIFAKYKKCTQVYCDRYAKGFDITRLALCVD